MLVSSDVSRISSRAFFLICAGTVISLLILAIPSRAQQAAPQPAPATPAQGSVPQKANPVTEVGKAVGSRPAEAPQVLQQLNSALEGLVAKVSPAVVQILVTGYGTLEENNRNETALVARQHAVGGRHRGKHVSFCIH